MSLLDMDEANRQKFEGEVARLVVRTFSPLGGMRTRRYPMRGTKAGDTVGLIPVDKILADKLLKAEQTFAPGKSGAQTSGAGWLRYMWQTPVALVRAFARRSWKGGHPGDGKRPYSILNWRKGVASGDVQFLRARYGNALQHMLKLGNGVEDADDDMQGNVDAIVWFAGMLADTAERNPAAIRKAFYSECREEAHE